MFKYDKISNFRLINAFIVSIGISLITPSLIILKGQLLSHQIIALFGILGVIAVKINNYLSKKPINLLYKITVFVHLLNVGFLGLYFIDPLKMLYTEMLVDVINVGLFSSYSISLNAILAKTYPESVHNFQISRNNIWANGAIIGLSLNALITLISADALFVTAIIYELLIGVWLLINFNFFKNIDVYHA